MRLDATLAAGLMAFAAGTNAIAQTASDSADDAAYAFGWIELSNGGTGFGPWLFASGSQNADGFAGQFLETEPSGGLSNVGTGDPGFAWTLFANTGTGLEQAAAFRAFNTPIAAGDLTFSISYEHGFIADGGLVGFSLRNGNTTDNAGDYGIGSRLQFFFQGGSGNYIVVDGDGLLDTGIPFTLDGLDISIDFTSANTYVLRVDRFGDELGSTLSYAFPERNLAGAGSVDSLAIFNDDGGSMDAGLNNDAYFNSIAIGPTPPANIVLDIDNNGTLDFFDVLAFLNAFDAAAP